MMIDNNIRQVNRELRKKLTKERFIERIEVLVREGLVEIIDCEEDGTPIVNITQEGLEVFLTELETRGGTA